MDKIYTNDDIKRAIKLLEMYESEDLSRIIFSCIDRECGFQSLEFNTRVDSSINE